MSHHYTISVLMMLLPRLWVRSKLTLLWGRPRLAWKGYSAGIARILEVDNFPAAAAPWFLRSGNKDSLFCPDEVPDPSSSPAQESQRLPWLPDWRSQEKRKRALRSMSGLRDEVSVLPDPVMIKCNSLVKYSIWFLFHHRNCFKKFVWNKVPLDIWARVWIWKDNSL